jgi:hypothetical protein
MQQQQQQSAPAMSFDQMEQMAMNVVEGICSIVSMPVEIILRPRYGTCYFPVPVVFFSAMLMIFLPLLSSMATGVINMIPFTHPQMPIGMFSIGSLSQLYFFLAFLHGIRIYRLMIYPELELNSEFEGPPLPFFRLIPGSGSFWFTRIVLEPSFVFVLATVLERIFVIQSGLSTYLHIAALSLVMKNWICWFKAWKVIRKALDIKNIGPIFGKIIENKATPDEMASVHIAGFPKNTPSEIRQAAGAYLARPYLAENDITSNR